MDEQLARRRTWRDRHAGRDRARLLPDRRGPPVRCASCTTNRERIRELGGLVLIDDEPEYLAMTADGTFRSRTRYQDDAGEWVSETEVIESAGELVELYNPADLYAAFAEAARIEAGLEPEPTAAEDLLEVAGVASEVGVEQEGRARAGEDWAGYAGTPSDKDDAARMLYDLALTFQERSQRAEARLLDDFQDASENAGRRARRQHGPRGRGRAPLVPASGAFEAEVVPEVRGRGRGRLAGRSPARRTSSSSTIPPTSSATWPRPSPTSTPSVAPEFEDEGDGTGTSSRRATRARARRPTDGR